jgi:hypothetical protein
MYFYKKIHKEVFTASEYAVQTAQKIPFIIV